MDHVYCIVFIVFLSLFFATTPGYSQGDEIPCIEHIIGIGDSLTAGVQNAALRQGIEGGEVESLTGLFQNSSYAYLIARQINPLNPDKVLPLPLIASPGIPNTIIGYNLNPGEGEDILRLEPGESNGRVDPSVQPFNLAIPGATLNDALTKLPSDDQLEALILGQPSGKERSQVQLALDLFAEQGLDPQKTLIIVWLGNNETLHAILEGDLSQLTPISYFLRDYLKVIRLLRQTGAHMVVANLPDTTIIPYLLDTVELAVICQAAGKCSFTDGSDFINFLQALDLNISDKISAEGLRHVLGSNPLEPLPSHFVFTSQEISAISKSIRVFNRIIQIVARSYDIPVVDIYNTIDKAHKEGREIEIDGQIYTLTTGLCGGLFSLDVVHPNNTGHALIAQQFIDIINNTIGRGKEIINPIDDDDELKRIIKNDPLGPVVNGCYAAFGP
jgi:hypothetical protein